MIYFFFLFLLSFFLFLRLVPLACVGLIRVLTFPTYSALTQSLILAGSIKHAVISESYYICICVHGGKSFWDHAHGGKSIQSKGTLEPFLNQFLHPRKLEMPWQCNTGNHKTVPWKTLFKAIKSNCATWC